MILPKMAWKSVWSNGVRGLEEEVPRLGQEQMRHRYDNYAADEDGQDQRHRLLETFIEAEAWLGLLGLPKQARASLVLGGPFRPKLINHGSLNPVAFSFSAPRGERRASAPLRRPDACGSFRTWPNCG